VFNKGPKEIAIKMLDFAPLPGVCLEIGKLADDPDCSMEKLAALVASDGALSAQVLRITNSPFYGYSAKIDSMKQAVQILGTDSLRNLVYASCFLSAYGALESHLVNSQNFWRHGLYTGIVARNLAKKCQLAHSERFFVAGLLHDVGRLALYTALEQAAVGILDEVEEEQMSLYRVERSLLGFSHCDVGMELMKIWNLPESMRQVAKFHHSPSMAEAYELEVSIIHIAEGIARGAGVFGSPEDVYGGISDHAWNLTGLDYDVVDEIVVKADSDYVDIAALFIERGYSTSI